MLTTLPAPQLSLLGGAADDVALVTEEVTLSYGELADRVAERRRILGETRRLIMLQASNSLEPLVTYLAALEGGHPILLVAPGDDEASIRHRASLAERFDPDVIAAGAGNGAVLHEVRVGSAHEFSPELALLVSTSGSTGSPKLVRLSRENLESNAGAIAEYLRLTPADRAVTTLPMHYCYGLSVINSHLLAGASIVLTSRSVTEAAFWDEARANQITSFAGVPYTFELLEKGGFSDRMPDSIRYLTQAGGRLAPEAVRRFARLGERRGFEFFVMYGQTEATARMAYVPAELAEHAAGSSVVRSPPDASALTRSRGGDRRTRVRGPERDDRLRREPGRLRPRPDVHALRTGDLARQRADGLFEVVGRMNRFVKVYGLRVDLDAVQRLLADEGIETRTASAGERLLVFVRAERQVHEARTRAAALLGIPVHAVRAYPISEFPCTSSGKPDFRALVRYADLLDGRAASPDGDDSSVTAESIRDLFIELLGNPDATIDDSFAGLGGDSLSYVEASLRLEEMLGQLPRDWPSRPARQLVDSHAAVAASRNTAPDAHAPEQGNARRSFFPRVETPAVLRAVAIVLIVATHADLIAVKGGAHLLLAVAGYNLARFQLADVPGATRVRRLLRSATQIAIPAVLWIGAVAVVSGKYSWSTALLLNNLVPGDGRWNEQCSSGSSKPRSGRCSACVSVRGAPHRPPGASAPLGVRRGVAGADPRGTTRADRRRGPAGRPVHGGARVVVSHARMGRRAGHLHGQAHRGLRHGRRRHCRVLRRTAPRIGCGDRTARADLGASAAAAAPSRSRCPAAGRSVPLHLPDPLGGVPAWEQSAPWFGTILSLLVGVAAWYGYRFAAGAVGTIRARQRAKATPLVSDAAAG